MPSEPLGTRRWCVLIAASDADLQQTARDTLERAGYGSMTAGSPQALRDALDRSVPDVVLLAFQGMKADDFALCRSLRAQAQHLPILVAAEAAPGVIGAATAAGASDFIDQPIRWEMLGYRVQNLRRSKRLHGALLSSREDLENTQRIARIGSWELSADSRSMVWSHETHRILGLVPDETKATFESFSLCIHPEDRAAVLEQISEARESGRSFAAAHRVVLATGSVRHVQLRGETILDGSSGGVVVHGTLQDVTEQRRAEARIQRLANFDNLTGLSNRRYFREKIEIVRLRAEQRGDRMALLYLDLDQFKRINDSLGHRAGDIVLQTVSRLIDDRVRGTDTTARFEEPEDVELSRLGGDEFAVLLTKVSQPEDAGQVARRILSAVTAPICVDGHTISTTASIGIAIYPEDGEDVETLLKHADRAMYSAKDRGRNTFQFFADTMNDRALRRLDLEHQLRDVLEKKELKLLYQPRVSFQTGRPSGVEALLRWQHPELGTIEPAEFIPIAEDTGHIVPIGAWVLEEACRQLQAWREAGHEHIRVSVNVSARQILRGDLVEAVTSALRESGADPKSLELEITESVMLEDGEATRRVLRELRTMGVRIALDDFGTGYSSLAYLSHFPLDTIKLDQSFIHNLASDENAQRIAVAVITMAHALSLTVVAEGVDAQKQVELLKSWGCDEMQGFLFSEAIPPADCVLLFQDPKPS